MNDNFRNTYGKERDLESASDWYKKLYFETQFPVAVIECARDIECTGIDCKNRFNPVFHPNCQRRESKSGKKFCFHRIYGEMMDGQKGEGK